MTSQAPPPRRWAARPAFGLAIAIPAFLVGCRSYERAPLDLAAHADALDARLSRSEPIAAFADRLRNSGADAPDRFDLTDGLSVAEGEVLALFYNPNLRLARLEAGVALAEYETAGLWEDPIFGFDGAEILSSSTPFQYGLTLSITIPISGRLEVEKERAGAAYEVQLRRIVDAEWGLRADVQRQWAEWSAAAEQVALLSDLLPRVREVRRVADRLEAAGELSRAEGRLFRVELAERLASLQAARLTEERARFSLLALLGLPPSASAELLPEMSRPEPTWPEDATERLIRANTQLAIRRAEYQVAEETLRLEVRKQYPDITIGSGYGSEEGDDRLLLGASLPIPVFNANRAGIAEADARRTLARAAAETTLEKLLHALAAAEASLGAVRSQRTQFADEVVPMLDEQMNELERLADLGELNALLLLETITRHVDAKSRLLELQAAEAESLATVVELLGPPTGTNPSPATPPASGESPDQTMQDSAEEDQP